MDRALILFTPRHAQLTAKKLIAAVGRAVLDGGDQPAVLAELDIAQRLGWTLSELDEQDETRVIPGLILQNKRDLLMQIKKFLDTHGQAQPSEDALKVYDEVNRLLNGEVDG